MQKKNKIVHLLVGQIILLFGLLLIGLPLQAQDLISNLANQYNKSAPNSPDRYMLTGKYAQAMYFNGQGEQAFQLLKNNIQSAAKYKDGQYAAYLHTVLAITLQVDEQTKEALVSLAKAKQFMSKTLSNEAKGYVMYGQGWIQVRILKEAEAVRSFMSALEYLDRAPLSTTLLGRKASVYKELTGIYSNWNEYELQEKYSKLTLDLSIQQNDPSGIFDGYMSLGYLNEQNFLRDSNTIKYRDLAEKYYLKALDTYQQNKNKIPFTSNLSFVSNNLAHLYFRFFPSSYREKAKKYAELAKSQGSESKEHNHVSSAYGIMAEMAIEDNNFGLAKEYLLASLSEINNSSNQDQNILMSIYESLSRISEKENNYKDAVKYYKEYMEIFKRVYDQDQLMLGKRLEAQFEKGKQEQQVQNLQLESEKKEQQLSLMAALGIQQKQELENMKLFQDNQSKELELAKLETEKQNQALRLSKLETENRAAEISQYQQEITFREKVNTYFILSFATIFLLFLVLLYAYQQRSKHMKQNNTMHQLEIEQERQNSKISTLTAMLQGQELERGRLARDLHDGLGGLLSGTKLHLSQLNDRIDQNNRETMDKTMGHLDLAVDELRRVAHNLMPDLLQKYGLQEALSDYATRMSTDTMDVDVQFLHYENKLPIDQQLIIYRIVQELVNNAVKHANPNQILIQVVEEEQAYHITVEDDGKGFDLQTLKSNQSAGLHNIQSRVEFLKGSVQINSEIYQGTSIEFQFPKPKIV
ncbi:sensor histidine kinase [Sphingobacterium sp. DK4209]|uniref:histidine kinase n=1 Tax=Sphingobacterium zhuxiongii TaxID=2662364 RepID=A0A5Q0QAE9_9SPHI|nr:MULTISPECIES: ATP-binding protein [unclassified Sphingobacterium]MVZ64767.1 sensor histidine kinase [Sphingobacterium sp. DK4209]QGA27097.1 sensor histidine kinase [Sphingobacterium sp. dk4302]